MRALVVALALTRVARADATFEDKARGATKADLDELAWTLVAKCDRGDDFAQRQCRLVRDAHAAELRGKVLAIDGDAKALSVGTVAGKQLHVVLDSKLRVEAIAIDGARWFATGKGLEKNNIASPSLAGFSPRELVGEEVERTAASLGTFRVEWLIQLDNQGSWWSVVGYRVIAPCDGSIVLAQPPSSPVAGDPKRCTAAPVRRSDPLAAEKAVLAALQPVGRAAHVCFTQFHVPGRAKLKLTIAPDGTIASYTREGDLDNSATGACIDEAVRKVKFPRSDQPVSVGYPIVVQ